MARIKMIIIRGLRIWKKALFRKGLGGSANVGQHRMMAIECIQLRRMTVHFRDDIWWSVVCLHCAMAIWVIHPAWKTDESRALIHAHLRSNVESHKMSIYGQIIKCPHQRDNQRGRSLQYDDGLHWALIKLIEELLSIIRRIRNSRCHARLHDYVMNFEMYFSFSLCQT